MDATGAVLNLTRFAGLGLRCECGPCAAHEIYLIDMHGQADFHAKYNGQKSECMEEAARIIAKAFGNCMTDRRVSGFSPFSTFSHSGLEHRLTRIQESGEFTTSSGWSLNATFGQVFSILPFRPLTSRGFQVKRISLSKNILRALEANDIPSLAEYPRSHQVRAYYASAR